ncbi:MAG: hypothetical protein QNJ22_00820 [Desulfosarcinaceae bacterium]|nr:hypothetical protein [Desulfosarcinaceae bacterium]
MKTQPTIVLLVLWIVIGSVSLPLPSQAEEVKIEPIKVADQI